MPDIIPVNANVHYKCAFDVSSESVPQLMTHLRKTFRSWCIRRTGDDTNDIHRAWFYTGNPRHEPQYVVNGYQLRTAIAPSDDPSEPNCWALEVIHPDDSEPARRWSVELALRKHDDGEVRFTTINKHWMQPYYIGEYPDAPSPSAPGYVQSLLSDYSLSCKRGDAVLSSNWHTVTNDDARTVFESLLSSHRQAPHIFLAAAPDTGRASIAPMTVMRAIVGNASLFYLPSPSVIDEMNYYLGSEFRCEPGMARVYLPGIDHNNPNNARLHRYLTASYIEEKGSAAIVRYIANGISRNGNTFRLNDITSIQHIFTERRKHAIKSLAAEKATASEESESIWNDYAVLSQKASSLEDSALRYEAENTDLNREVSMLKYRISELDGLRSELDHLKSQVGGLEKLEKLPTSLAGVLESVESLFPERIKLMDQAIASAQSYSNEHGGFWNKQDQLSIAWSLTFDLATKLYGLMFIEKAANFESEYNSRSTFELAMSEGKKTKRDGRLMKLRKVDHDGRELDITPHIKYGNRPPKLLRLYFAIDNDAKKFIIGYVSSHLENATSQKW